MSPADGGKFKMTDRLGEIYLETKPQFVSKPYLAQMARAASVPQ